jgi:hypothetical protein
MKREECYGRFICLSARAWSGASAAPRSVALPARYTAGRAGAFRWLRSASTDTQRSTRSPLGVSRAMASRRVRSADDSCPSGKRQRVGRRVPRPRVSSDLAEYQDWEQRRSSSGSTSRRCSTARPWKSSPLPTCASPCRPTTEPPAQRVSFHLTVRPSSVASPANSVAPGAFGL